MTEIERNMMLGMIDILNVASEAYYNSDTPIMDDETYDMRLKDLQEFEKDTGVIFSNSPTINVGAKILSNLPEVKHNHLMLSLDKCHSPNEIIDFSNNKELIASIKLDGMTASLLYEDGALVRAESRGNGYVGVDITEHVKKFKNVPLKINKVGTYIVDGECIITDEDFVEVNKNKEYKNSRNLVSGTLNSLDTSLVIKRKVSFMVWNVVEGGTSNNLKDNLNEAKELNFDVVPFWSAINLEIKKLQNTLDYIFEYATDNYLPCDGIVFKFNDIKYGKSLGNTSHHFNDGIAYKAKDDVYKTELVDIDWTMGKTGILTPTAVFKSVKIDGTMVERASVHNVSILTSLDLHIGDTIEVFKANSVIPQVKRNISSEERMMLSKDSGRIVIPSKCPICGGTTEIKQDNDSQVLVCTNPHCKGKLLGKLTHFVSKNAMNIDGLSSATLEKFIELGWLTCFEDVYNLSVEENEMKKLEGFGEKSVSNLLTAIDESTNTTLDRFIYALSIPLIGRSASKEISKSFNGDFETFYNVCCKDTYDFTRLNDFGDAMNESINQYLKENAEMIANLSKYMNFKIVQNTPTSNSLKDKTFCITGKLNHFANRDEAKEKIESLGGKVSESVSAKTSFLVNNDINSASSKNKKAKDLNIPIITELELVEMLK